MKIDFSLKFEESITAVLPLSMELENEKWQNVQSGFSLIGGLIEYKNYMSFQDAYWMQGRV